uniref:ATP synthase complex subunit 8 n=1 Tax=Empria sp. TaxID=2821552 RepID=A0A8A6C6H4_9HYME|nr:ATP synthase F0 subunit 8 [Empria sp.]
MPQMFPLNWIFLFFFFIIIFNIFNILNYYNFMNKTNNNLIVKKKLNSSMKLLIWKW